MSCRRFALTLAVPALAVLAFAAGPAGAITYQIRWDAFASAGGAPVTVGALRLGQSAGQSVAGAGTHGTAPAFAEGAGYWHWAGAFPLVGVDEPAVAEVRAYALDAGAPNPFARTTAIRYAIPTAVGTAPVALRIYDLSGRMVRSLDAGVRASGVHTVHWDGADAAGHPLGGGVYFVRITTGPFAATRRLVLTR